MHAKLSRQFQALFVPAHKGWGKNLDTTNHTADSGAGPNAEPSHGIIWDQDNYLLELDRLLAQMDESERPQEREIYKAILSRHADPVTFQLLNTYYFQLRGAVSFYGDLDEKFMKETVPELRKIFLHNAGTLTVLHQRGGKPIAPAWLKIAKDNLLAMMTETFPDADSIEIEIDQVPRLQCRATHDRKIRVSALTREIYLHFNLLLWPRIEEFDQIPQETHYPALVRMMLPYFIQMNDFVPVSRLPQAFGGSKSAVEVAYAATHYQVLFLLAHEYGHLRYEHHLRPPQDKDEAINREFEADRFAFTSISKHLDQPQFDIFYAVVRWLFQQQMIDEAVGALLRGQDLDLEEILFRKRTNELYSCLLDSHTPTRTGNWNELQGTGMLMELKHKIIGLGAEKLRWIAGEVSKDLTEGEPVHWWEEVS
jgi:hypothetical protein